MEKLNLRQSELFLSHEESLSEWNSIDLTNFVAFILHNESPLKHLKGTQVKYQYRKYVSESLVREKFGNTLHQVTESFCAADNYFINDGIMAILSNLYLRSTIGSKAVLPTKLHEFLKRVWKTELTSIGNNNEHKPINYLQPDDKERLMNLIYYIKSFLIPLYSKSWKKVSNICDANSAKVSSKIDSILSEIELEVTLQRLFITSNSTSTEYEIFFKLTCLNEFVVSIPNIDLFESEYYADFSNQNEYVQLVMCDTPDRQPLHNLLFANFEDCVYNYYTNNLAIQELCILQMTNKCSANDEYDCAEDDLNTNVSDNLHKSEISRAREQINIEMTQILYYIAGYTFHSTMCVLNSNTLKYGGIKSTLLNSLTVNYQTALNELHLPCELVKIREKNDDKLICVSENVFNIILEMELNVFQPFFSNLKLIVCLGNNSYAYLKHKLYQFEFHLKLQLLFENALQNLVECDFNLTLVLEHLCDKFVEHYANINAKEFTKYVMKKAELSNNIFKAVGVRVKILTNTLLEDE